MAKHFTRISEISNEIEDLYNTGLSKGLYCGFEELYDYYSPKMGTTTYIYASPFSGKSEWWFEILISLSELYGMKHAIYSPETGTAKEIAAELISKAARKPFYSQMGGRITESEFFRYIDWVNEHFFIIDPKETDLTVDEFYEQVDEIEKMYDIKISTTLADPFNEMRHNISGDGRQDLYIENKLGMVRRNAQLHNRHNVLITHTASQELIKVTGKDGRDIWFNPPPNPNKLSGGMAWNRKAMNLIALWRPPMGLENPETGEPYADNEVHVIIQKFKPKGTGKRGTIKFYFDVSRNRYFEIHNGDPRYSSKKVVTNPLAKQIKYDF